MFHTAFDRDSPNLSMTGFFFVLIFCLFFAKKSNNISSISKALVEPEVLCNLHGITPTKIIRGRQIEKVECFDLAYQSLKG